MATCSVNFGFSSHINFIACGLAGRVTRIFYNPVRGASGVIGGSSSLLIFPTSCQILSQNLCPWIVSFATSTEHCHSYSLVQGKQTEELKGGTPNPVPLCEISVPVQCFTVKWYRFTGNSAVKGE